ncbi:MAG: hypothetical protein JWN60_893, partial [Acidobacteria bacterium]|nr:hypothetical protein [Acidobacteriota bacterium]
MKNTISIAGNSHSKFTLLCLSFLVLISLITPTFSLGVDKGAPGKPISSSGFAETNANKLTAPSATMTNSAAITINDRPSTAPANPAPATPYPSGITFSGLAGTVSGVSLTLNNVTHARPRDIDVLLVAPDGTKSLIVMADAGGLNAISGVNITLDDAAAAILPGDAAGMTDATITTGSYKPTNGVGGAPEPDAFPAPAPTSGYGLPAPTGSATFASVFNGTSPNGTWNLYVLDDSSSAGATGSIAGGWTLNVTTAASGIATTTTLTSAPNPSFADQPVAFTATVASGSGTPTGTVTFAQGATTLSCGTVAVNGSGQAVCNIPAGGLAEGSNVITATYNPTGSFSTSNGSVTHTVNNQTTVAGSQYCNSGAITVNDTTSTTPYPSNIFVSGLSGNIGKVVLTLNNITTPRPRELDILLIGPSGQKFVPISDVGDLTAATGITLVLDDAAANPLPTGDGSVLSGGTFRPTDFTSGGSEVFPAPAPAGPYNSPGPNGTATFANTFNGTNPNGQWNLYIVDDSPGGGTSTISGGWCLTFEVVTPPTITKSFVQTSLPLGSTGTMRFVVNNPEPAKAISGISFTDTLPAGISVGNGSSAVCGGTLTTAAPNSVSFAGGTLAGGASCTIDVGIVGSQAGAWNNTTSVVSSTQTGAGAASNTATLTVVAPPNVSKAFSPAIVNVNDITTLTITLTNPSANTVALSGVGVTDSFPNGLIVAAVPAVTNTCGGTFTAAAGASSISLSGGTIPLSGSCAVSVKVRATFSGDKVNTTGTVTSTNGGTGGTASATLAVNALNLEGDINPRPNQMDNPTPGQSGDSVVTSGDVTQIRRFVLGQDTADSITTNEFQKADTAPFDTKGDGNLNSGDVTQIRRYVLGIDPPTAAAGPTMPATPQQLKLNAETSKEAESYNQLAPQATRTLSVVRSALSENILTGNTLTVAVQLNTDASKIGATAFNADLNYDTAVLSNPTNVRPAPGVSGVNGTGTGGTAAAASGNLLSAGVFRVLADLPPPQTFGLGRQ